MLENIRRHFFWGYKDEERGTGWIGWNKVLSPFEKGGLGIGSIQEKKILLSLASGGGGLILTQMHYGASLLSVFMEKMGDYIWL